MFGQCGTTCPYAMVQVAPFYIVNGHMVARPPMAPAAAEDSDSDYDAMDPQRTLLTLSRRDKIKVIEFSDPNVLTRARLSQLTDKQLAMMCFILTPDLCAITVQALGVGTMAGFKRMIWASSTDNGIMEHLMKDDALDFGNLEALATSNGWLDHMANPTVNCELRMLPRPRPSRWRNLRPASSEPDRVRAPRRAARSVGPDAALAEASAIADAPVAMASLLWGGHTVAFPLSWCNGDGDNIDDNDDYDDDEDDDDDGDADGDDDDGGVADDDDDDDDDDADADDYDDD
eukprot:9481394-Pyramimonas_sp.AAC.1